MILSFRSPYNTIFLTTLEHYFVSVKFTLKVTLSKFGACKHQCKNSIKKATNQPTKHLILIQIIFFLLQDIFTEVAKNINLQ